MNEASSSQFIFYKYFNPGTKERDWETILLIVYLIIIMRFSNIT